jgi:hypothetical protein
VLSGRMHAQDKTDPLAQAMAHTPRQAFHMGPLLLPVQTAGENVDSLPELPRNARYVVHSNECYDWGTFGWLFSERKVDPSAYRYIIFLNSSVRGPFLPSYWPVCTRGRQPWPPIRDQTSYSACAIGTNRQAHTPGALHACGCCCCAAGWVTGT